MSQRRYVIGIDEVGRGPLAGPVAVCGYMLPAAIARRLPRQKDSKQLSRKAREALYPTLTKDPRAAYKVVCVDAKTIDRIGIAPAIHKAIQSVLRQLPCDPKEVTLYLDGGLRAPSEYVQHTIIRGDALIPVIAYASIVAKVTRDRKMTRYAKKYPKYGFERNAGYGTKEHINAIHTFGTTPMHRKSFLTRIISLN